MAHILLVETSGPQSMAGARGLLESAAHAPVNQAASVRALRDSLAAAAGKVVIINASLLESAEVAKVSTSLDSHGAPKPFGYLPLNAGGTVIDFPPPEKAALVPWLKNAAGVPFLVISGASDIYKDPALFVSEDFCETITRLFIGAVLKGFPIGKCPQPFHLEESAMPGLSLSSASRAALLRTLLESFNIEELFPSHEWSKFPQESLAVCYHTSAALFLSWGDYDSVESCLKQSDPLEDSPRSWGLRGLLALKRNEVLGATAHLISSLQQYEARKRSGSAHYLSFAPKSFEDINRNLKTGLEHLNRKENEQAAECFLSAIFDFDPFYQEYGVIQRAGGR